MMFYLLLPFTAALLSPNLQAALVVIDSFSGSYLNRDIPHEGGSLNIRVTGDTNDSFLSVQTGSGTGSSFHKSAIMLADSDAGTTDLRLTFSTPVTNLAITFADVDADATSTLTAPTPNDVLIAYEYAGNARVVTTGGNSPNGPSGLNLSPITVVGQPVRAGNTGTSAIARFEFASPQTFVRINYQNGAGSGSSGGVGVTEIRFDAVPEPSAPAVLSLAATSLLRRRR